MYRVDFHSHSRFFHAWPGSRTAYDPVGLRTIAAMASARGLDAVVVTNHDYTYPRDPKEVAGVTLIPGIEVSTSDGHVLIVGPDPPAQTTPRELSAPEAVGLAHDRNCVAILAHPFRGSEARHTNAPFDAVELNGKNFEHVDQTRELAAERKLPLVGGSDAHYPPELGRMYTEVDCRSLAASDVAEAVREGKTTPAISSSVPQRALSGVYTVIHKAKGKE